MLTLLLHPPTFWRDQGWLTRRETVTGAAAYERDSFAAADRMTGLFTATGFADAAVGERARVGVEVHRVASTTPS